MSFRAFFLLLISISACSGGDRAGQIHSFTELAMVEGMTIRASNRHGTVTIEYVSELGRRYSWGDFDEVRILTAREARFNGELGAYDPGEKYFWQSGPRIVAVDSQLAFDAIEEALAWLIQSDGNLDWVVSNEGIAVGFSRSEGDEHVLIYVYEILVDGELSEELSGYFDGPIEILRDVEDK